ncbi:MAG: ribosome silencing factor [Oscillospiraceae bacterium]|nr:ribosome silencing factor [Oscillospiraceae bacterium]
MSSLEIARAAASALDSKLGRDIKIIKIADLTVIADYFVIATGTSNTQVKALASEVEHKLEEQGLRPLRSEGAESALWMLLDYGSVVVHVFRPETREFYSLERLWADGEEIETGFEE